MNNTVGSNPTLPVVITVYSYQPFTKVLCYLFWFTTLAGVVNEYQEEILIQIVKNSCDTTETNFCPVTIDITTENEFTILRLISVLLPLIFIITALHELRILYERINASSYIANRLVALQGFHVCYITLFFTIAIPLFSFTTYNNSQYYNANFLVVNQQLKLDNYIAEFQLCFYKYYTVLLVCFFLRLFAAFISRHRVTGLFTTCVLGLWFFHPGLAQLLIFSGGLQLYLYVHFTHGKYYFKKLWQ
jgi:hypothetical protein